MDLLAELYLQSSSYAYVLNDPVSKLDPNGMSVQGVPDTRNKDTGIKYSESGHSYPRHQDGGEKSSDARVSMKSKFSTLAPSSNYLFPSSSNFQFGNLIGSDTIPRTYQSYSLNALGMTDFILSGQTYSISKYVQGRGLSGYVGYPPTNFQLQKALLHEKNG